MKHSWVAGLLTIGLVFAQSDTPEAHRALAKAAAGTDHMGLYNTVCPEPATAPRPAAARGRGAAPAVRQDPPRDQWYAEPVKVFDNLYYVGTKIHGAWAVTTSDGIIVIDALFGYAAEPEIAEGLRKLNLDPAKIKYAVISHGHGDHSGGAKFLQDTFNAHLLLSAADWDLLDRDTRNPKPRRDMVVTDGQKLTLGDTTITMYITPGHTLGTISTLVPVKDNGKPHMAMEWGGTAFSAATPTDQLKSYISSAARFEDVALGAGADVIIANHTVFDGTLEKLAALEKRTPGEPNPWVVGKDSVKRYLTVASECAKAALSARQ
jgi:metallo-beta-lactamase class B